MEINGQAGRKGMPRVPLVFAAVVLLAGLYFARPLYLPDGAESAPTLLVEPAGFLPTDSTALYYSGTLAGEIIAEMAGHPSIHVFAPHTALTAPKEGDSSGHPLNAKYLLTSFLSTTKTSIALDVMLFDTSSPSPVWTSRIDKSNGEFPIAVLALADTVSMLIAGTPGTRIGPTVVWKGDAYSWYLFGRFILSRPDLYNSADAIFAFQRSLQEDPDSPQTHAALAWTLLLDYESRESFSPYHIESASIQVKEALALKWRTAESLGILALTEQYRANFDEALARMKEAVELSPGDAESLRRLADLQLLFGNQEEALSAATRALGVDPLNERSFTTIARIHEYNGDHTAAIAAYTAGGAVSANGTRYRQRYLPERLAMQNRHDEASETLGETTDSPLQLYRRGRVHQVAGGDASFSASAFARADSILTERLRSVPNDQMGRAYRALVLARTERWEEGVSELGKIDTELNPHPVILYMFARFYSIKGELETASGYLGKAIQRKYLPDQLLDPDLAVLWDGPPVRLVAPR